jgi:hypothetical protein
MAWIDWHAVITALDGGHLPSSGTEKHILRIAASLAGGHPVNLRDAIPGLDQRNVGLVVLPSVTPQASRPATDRLHPVTARRQTRLSLRFRGCRTRL